MDPIIVDAESGELKDEYNQDVYIKIGRYTRGMGTWFSSILFTTKSGAEGDSTTYAEWFIAKIRIPSAALLLVADKLDPDDIDQWENKESRELGESDQ
jgi:hypothetical protein